MKTWKIVLVVIGCFLVVGLVDRPEYYSFELAEPSAPQQQCDEYIRLFTDHKNCPICGRKPVDNSVKNPANVVFNPSPISWR